MPQHVNIKRILIFYSLNFLSFYLFFLFSFLSPFRCKFLLLHSANYQLPPPNFSGPHTKTTGRGMITMFPSYRALPAVRHKPDKNLGHHSNKKHTQRHKSVVGFPILTAHNLSSLPSANPSFCPPIQKSLHNLQISTCYGPQPEAQHWLSQMPQNPAKRSRPSMQIYGSLHHEISNKNPYSSIFLVFSTKCICYSSACTFRVTCARYYLNAQSSLPRSSRAPKGAEIYRICNVGKFWIAPSVSFVTGWSPPNVTA